MTDTKKRRAILVIFVLFFSAFAVRLFFALKYMGFLSDLSCFYIWATRAFEVGLPNFYADNFFSDYPPGYIYILYIAGALLSTLESGFVSPSCLMILKLPAIICDMVTGLLIYRYASKRNDSMAALLTAFYLFNPAIIQNSAMWGQVDSVFTLALTLMTIFLSEKKTIPAYFAFAIGILIKPQTLIFSPLILLGIYENVFRGGFKKGKFFKDLFCGLSAIGLMLAAFLPFGIERIIRLYFSTMSSYPYASVNAYNFWSMLGLNWASQDTSIIGPITYKTVGSAVILLICLFSAIIFIKRISNSDRYWVTGAFIMSTMFIFSVRMHERYLFPVLIFLIMSYAENKRQISLFLFELFSLLMYFNLWSVLLLYDNEHSYSNPILVEVISTGMVAAGILLYISIPYSRKHSNDKPAPPSKENLIFSIASAMLCFMMVFYKP